MPKFRRNGRDCVNEPNAQVWKKLNEVVERLQVISNELTRSNTINEGFQKIQDQQRVKIETLERENNRAQGAISLLRWAGIFLLGIAVSGGTWTISSINQLKQDMAVMKSKEEHKK